MERYTNKTCDKREGQEDTTKEKCVAGPVVMRAQSKKSNKVYPLKVKEAI